MAKVLGAQTVVTCRAWTTDHAVLFAFALACILSGALGNVIDRMVHGYVVDFLQFHFRFLEAVFVEGKFPTFNVADVAISVGAIGLILDEFLRVRKAR